MALPKPQLVDLRQYTTLDRVRFLPAGTDKATALTLLAEDCSQAEAVHDPAAFSAAIFEREQVSSTGIGNGIAVPHAKLPSVDTFTIAIGICPDGLDFAARDDQDVSIIIMIAASDQDRDIYLRVLATVASQLKCEQRRARLAAATDASTALDALCTLD